LTDPAIRLAHSSYGDRVASLKEAKALFRAEHWNRKRKVFKEDRSPL
jgi:hypothetical protein